MSPTAPDGHAEVVPDLEPRSDVCVVVERRDDDLVALAQRACERPGQKEVERGHTRPEGDLLGRAAEERARPLVGALDDLVRLAAGLVGRADVGVRVAQVARDRVDHLVGTLSTARAVEECEWPLQCREARAHGLDVEERRAHAAGCAVMRREATGCGLRPRRCCRRGRARTRRSSLGGRRPLPGRTVVPVAGFRRGAVERVHRRVLTRRKGDVHSSGRGAREERERPVRPDEVRAILRRCVWREPAVRRDELVEPAGGVEVGDPHPQVVDSAALGRRLVNDGLDAVSVGVEKQAAVVARAVLRSRSGRSVLAEACPYADGPELVDSRTRGCQKPRCSLRVGGFPSLAAASEKSPHSTKCSSLTLFSIAMAVRTVS